MADIDSVSLLKETLTLILAGGQGERLYPLTRDRAKPAVPFGGIYRFIDFTLSNCLNSNLRRIYLLTQYKSSSLDLHLRLGWSILSEELGEFIHTIPPQQRLADHWYRGTADAIFQNIYTLQQERPERVLILSGDHIYKMDYSRLLQAHVDTDASLTVACVEVPIEQASQLGVMSIDANSRIIGFEEKPEAPQPLPDDPTRALASMGVYVFNTNELVRTVVEDARRNTAHDFGKNIIPSLVRGGKVFAYNFKHGNCNPPSVYWRDIGLIDTYWSANMDLVDNSPAFDLFDTSWPIRTYQEPYPPVRIVQSMGEAGESDMANVILSGGCRISNAKLDKCVFSHGVQVESGAQLSESILMEGVRVGQGAKIRKAIVDKDVIIPPNCKIGYDPEHDRQRFAVTPEEIVIVPKGLPIEA
jgi:glucose-1-phosphate adenylyltransferase